MRWLAISIALLLMTAARPDAHTEMWWRDAQVQQTLRLTPQQVERPVADVCRHTGIAEARFYLWKNRYGSLGVPEVRELRQMRNDNARLKRLVADLTLDKQILQDVIRQTV